MQAAEAIAMHTLHEVLSAVALPADCRVQLRELNWLCTPLEAAGRLAEQPGMVFLDCNSLEYSNWGGISIVAAGPLIQLRIDGNGRSTITLRGSHAACVSDADPLKVMDTVLAAAVSVQAPPEPPFAGGWIGVLAYEFGRFIEDLPATTVEDIHLPVAWLGFYDQAAVFDHRRRRWFRVTVQFSDSLPAGEPTWMDDLDLTAESDSPVAELTGPVTANMSAHDYRRIVARTVQYIHAGDIFQANVSRRLSAGFTGRPWPLYRRLRAANPGGFNAYLNVPGGTILSTSPELFLQVDKDFVLTRPIKGTRPRGDTAAEDRRLADELLASGKDRAELNMIIDLLRNDLGRVCRFGTVRVLNDAVLETHPSVFHLVGEVEGRLRVGLPQGGFVDLIRASFPGGSITGAPKIRAMQIIDELEPTARSAYTGSIGYLSLNGRSAWNIAIRTAICSEGKLHLQLGAGIVADSDPQAEYEETLAKGKAMLAGLGVTLEED